MASHDLIRSYQNLEQVTIAACLGARLSRLVGPLWAKQLIMTCDNITAEQAVSIGPVSYPG